ncbi:MAG TPA: cystathionine beta-lyase [Gemmatimonadaceae bacterium]|jgi:cystathionine beta-lyase|nr:cystathionine beta-lyase [Gemmatimonadaceae bacterium]
MSERSSKRPQLSIDTLLAHSGGDPVDRQGAVNPPVYRASTFLFPTVADWEGSRVHERRFDVIRYGQLATPTTLAFEEAMAALEGGYRSMLVPSGLAAVTVALQGLVKAGDHILVADTAYVPTRIFCDRVLKRFGVETTYYDPLIGATIDTLFRANTRLVFLESPGSMTFEIQDVPAIANAARARGILTLLDNSWATPYLFPAFAHGVDVSILAATKYIGGHSDVMMGTITTTEALYDRVRSEVAELGLCVSSDDAYLALRGLRTLSVRLERHQRNATQVAEWLSARPEVARVTYPVLPNAPGHALWKRDFRGASGLFGVELRPVAKPAVDAFLDSLELFGMGASFGGFESLAVPMDPRPYRTATRWAHDGPLIRLHVGLEDPNDLIADLARGFERMKGD